MSERPKSQKRPAILAVAIAIGMLLLCAFDRYPQGISIQGFNAVAGRAWQCTNATTGEGQWSDYFTNLSVGYFNVSNGYSFWLTPEKYYRFLPGGQNGEGLVGTNATGIAFEWYDNEWRFQQPVKVAGLILTNQLTVSGGSGRKGDILLCNPFTLRPQWGRSIIAETFDLGASLFAAGNTAGGGASGVFNGLPGSPQGHHGFFQCTVQSTNGLGATHTSGLRYTSSRRYLIESNVVLHTDVMLETGNSNHCVQIGIMTSGTDTNQTTAGGIWWEAHMGNHSNWIFRCLSPTGASLSYTSSVPATNMNVWWNLGFEGNTNRMVAFTNGAPAWTNTTATSMPGGSLLLYSFLVSNARTNANAAASAHNVWFDNFHIYDY